MKYGDKVTAVADMGTQHEAERWAKELLGSQLKEFPVECSVGDCLQSLPDEKDNWKWLSLQKGQDQQVLVLFDFSLINPSETGWSVEFAHFFFRCEEYKLPWTEAYQKAVGHSGSVPLWVRVK